MNGKRERRVVEVKRRERSCSEVVLSTAQKRQKRQNYEYQYDDKKQLLTFAPYYIDIDDFIAFCGFSQESSAFKNYIQNVLAGESLLVINVGKHGLSVEWLWKRYGCLLSFHNPMDIHWVTQIQQSSIRVIELAFTFIENSDTLLMTMTSLCKRMLKDNDEELEELLSAQYNRTTFLAIIIANMCLFMSSMSRNFTELFLISNLH